MYILLQHGEQTTGPKFTAQKNTPDKSNLSDVFSFQPRFLFGEKN